MAQPAKIDGLQARAEEEGAMTEYCVHVEPGGPRRLRLGMLVAPLLGLALAATTVEAQITRGAISGTVRDSSGGIVPGATVTVTNAATNSVRTAVTDEQGFYRVAALEPGRYMVDTELAGFAKVQHTDIDVSTATEVTIDVQLKPGSIGESVQVTADAVTVDLNRTSPTLGRTLDSRQVVELPLPGGRNINNLILTVPNAVSTTGQGTYAVNGQRSRNNNYMIDGSDNNDISVTIATSQLVPESVAEFQVLSNPYSVEFGRNSGGMINVITKSGTNSFRGSAWDYYTTNELYSLNNLEKAQNLEKPPRFNRHQAGGALGGPIVRNRTFFFGLYQYDAQRPGARPGNTVTTLTPQGYAALQNMPLGPGQTPASRQAVLERIRFLENVYAENPTFRTLSTTLVNDVPIQTGLTNVSIVDPSTYHTALGRGDHRLFQADTLTVRYSLNDRVDENAISNCAFGALFCGNQDLVDTNFAASHASVFSPRMLNEFRFSWVRRDLDFPENDPISPTATITGLFTIGGASNFPQYRITDQFQFSDLVTWNKERHTFKFGADIRYNKVDNGSAFDSKGTFTFNNLQDYTNNLASSFAQALQTASFQTDQWQSSFFLQDDFRLTQDLTINLGLRYEVSTVPLGMFGATDPESLGALVPGPVQRDNNNWAPRVGFAWSPPTNNWLTGDRQTVIRGGYGFGYDILFYNLLTVNGSNYPRVVVGRQLLVQNVYPNLIPVSGAAVFNPLASYTNSAEDTENPESRFYSLTVQRELGSYILEAGYTGSRSYKGINQVHINPAILTAEQAALVASTRNAQAIPNAQARRIFPQFGIRTIIPATVGPAGNDVEARAEYNAFLTSVQKRLSKGLQFGASYTYSRWYSNNDASLAEGGTADGSSQRPQSMFDYEAEWSRSQFDRPHRLALSYIFQIPGPKTGFLGAALGGWQIAGITAGQSGRPFTIVTGVDSNGDDNTGSDRPNLDPSGRLVWDDHHRSFTNEGRYVAPLGTNNLPLQNALGNGNAPRNADRGAHFWNTDLSLSKRFGVGVLGNLLFRIDVFNLLNQDNYGNPNVNMSSTTFGTNGNNWGRRSAQISGKLEW
jgi:hypothetical protein